MRYGLCPSAQESVSRLSDGQYRLDRDSSGVYLVRLLTGQRAQIVETRPVSCDFSKIRTLSTRERQVLELMGDGQDMNDIAAHMNLSVKTIETYRARLKKKLDVRKRTQLLRLAVEWNQYRTDGLPAEPDLSPSLAGE
jgi:DNA-binding NarL/FixJ family response regulator